MENNFSLPVRLQLWCFYKSLQIFNLSIAAYWLGIEFTSTSTLLYEIVIMENVFGVEGLIRLQNFLTCLSHRAPIQAAFLYVCSRSKKKCVGILKGSYHSKLSWSDVHVEAQNIRRPTSVVLFCRFRGSKWRILLQQRQVCVYFELRSLNARKDRPCMCLKYYLAIPKSTNTGNKNTCAHARYLSCVLQPFSLIVLGVI